MSEGKCSFFGISGLLLGILRGVWDGLVWRRSTDVFKHPSFLASHRSKGGGRDRPGGLAV
jgi:hypothetical protein